MKPLAQNFADGLIPPQDGLQIRPMQKDDIYAMIGLTGAAATGNLWSLRAQYESHLGSSFVAVNTNGHMAGFILGARHAQEFPHGIGITNVVIDNQQCDATLCARNLVRMMAILCLQRGQKSLDMVVFNNDSSLMDICGHYSARKGETRKGISPDGQSFTADFYTIGDLSEKIFPTIPAPRP